MFKSFVTSDVPSFGLELRISHTPYHRRRAFLCFRKNWEKLIAGNLRLYYADTNEIKYRMWVRRENPK
jgi:hypothetical protein